jgi:serine/threonine protein kinase
VWFRLLRQTAQGIHAAHAAGLAHGHLQANRILLTADGVVKIAGFGEPHWLTGNPKSEIRNPKQNLATEDTEIAETQSSVLSVSSVAQGSSIFAGDVRDLCKIAAAWATPPAKKKGVRSKPYPKPLRKILDRLKSEDAEARYSSANALLDDLAQATDHVPDNPEAWDKLLSNIRDQGKEDAPLKQSA